MINLLPPDVKENTKYARRNRTLTRWCAAMGVGIFGIAIVVAGGLFFIHVFTSSYTKEVQQSKDQLAAQKLEETQKRVEDISSSVKLTLQVLSREVLFSKLLQDMGATIPTGATLQNLTLGNLEGGIDLQVLAKDYQTATQVQVNLQDPDSKVFEKADIISINCATPGENSEPTEYPCQVSLRALFAKDNPYTFTSNTGGTR